VPAPLAVFVEDKMESIIAKLLDDFDRGRM